MKTEKLNYLKNFFSKRNSIIRATSAFCVSLLLIIWPELLSTTLLIIIGSLMIAYAIFDIAKTIYNYCKNEPAPTAETVKTSPFLDILKSIKPNTYLFLLTGILLIALKNVVLTAITIVLAAALILSAMLQLWATVSWMSLTKPEEATKSKASQAAKWIFLAFPLISIILAIVILSNPFGSLKALLIFTGSSLMFYGITEIARTIYFKATHQDTGETPKLLE